MRSLLFILATWHSLAKLRMHTDSTLLLLDDATTCLGSALRHFASSVSSNFPTKETPTEYAKRQRAATTSGSTVSNQGRQPKGFNLHTIKLHSLGDYMSTIRHVGSTDNYTTATVGVLPLLNNASLNIIRVSWRILGRRHGGKPSPVRGTLQSSLQTWTLSSSKSAG